MDNEVDGTLREWIKNKDHTTLQSSSSEKKSPKNNFQKLKSKISTRFLY